MYGDLWSGALLTHLSYGSEMFWMFSELSRDLWSGALCIHLSYPVLWWWNVLNALKTKFWEHSKYFTTLFAFCTICMILMCHYKCKSQLKVCWYFNSLWQSDIIWRWGFWSILVQVMACCPMAPSHYLNQHWLIINEAVWHLFQGNIYLNTQDINPQIVIEIYKFDITATSQRDWWVNWFTCCGLMSPYGDKDLGQHWLRWWLVAWCHQAITWTSVTDHQ